MGWFKLVGCKVLVGEISFFFGQILVSRKFVEDYHVRSAPPVTRAVIDSRVKFYPTIGVPLLLVR